jgi:hypothetical protein
MGGFFLDNLISRITKNNRSESRASAAGSWSIVDAKITESGYGYASGKAGITYSYEVNGETWYGSCMSYPLRINEVEKLRSVLSEFSALRVRFDPTDPAESRVLNRDNPKLPFEIDYDPY